MARHSWRDGDLALCGASLVRIAALDDVRALVVGSGQFGPWSIWMEASKLQRVEELGHAAIRPTENLPVARAAFCDALNGW